jgi:formamidase
MKGIKVDRTKRQAGEPSTGHNRWHPDIAPALDVNVGEAIELETRDAFDGQIGPSTTTAEVGKLNLNLIHPLTGPVFVNGAEAGDLLEIEIVEVTPARFAYTVEVPGFGFLRDEFPDPFIVKWSLSDGWAESKELPGVRIRGASFPGVIGLAPSRELMARITQREQRLLDKGGFVLGPDPVDAVPNSQPISSEGLRTIPPREIAGNVDIKQLAAGVKLYIPVSAKGALFSIGDAHFAQGDSECCGTAIEMEASFVLRFRVIKGAAGQGLWFQRSDYSLPPELAAPRRFVATTGLSVTRDGENHSEDATLAARNALLNMIDYLVRERGFTRQQSYAICSVAVDLKISEMVDVPNFVVSAFLPLDVFV